ncbi:MAG: hypothetical protein Q4C65_02440 [Eubacteriales bacterium]|nr:hypothetical protein [Eubacteriales bacterium]
MLGKTVEELQENVAVGEEAITGTLKYVTGYTGFNGSNPEEQSGNYIVMRVDPDEQNATITVELIGSLSGKGPVTLDSDRVFVFRISDKDNQKIKVTVEGANGVKSRTYRLSGLVLKEK